MWDHINKRTEEWEQRMFTKTYESILTPLGREIKESAQAFWHWFVDNLPYIAGYGVVATGAFIMIAPMVSRSGILKPLGFLAAGLTLTVCILMTN